MASRTPASGSCAVVAVLGGGRLYLAHIGDSRAVLCSGDGYEAVPLTADHKPDSDEERAREAVAVGAALWIRRRGRSAARGHARALGHGRHVARLGARADRGRRARDASRAAGESSSSGGGSSPEYRPCLLYTSDAADE